ncbi:hypothetical protein THII_2409 [Thioploca ingrica]|uniref:Polymorphic outer membrane protein n=1 Tax=Thioploca ingrica TaxID=40754 RepID=A0A090BVE3_9GAMM|nr:hypothetical protein THII_2409 [Thioploca ingrica]
MKPITNRKKLLSLLISQALVAPAQATVIDVNCGNVTDLINAINTANSNSDADEINLNVDNQANCVYPLTAVNNNRDGANGLPSIYSKLTINGHRSAIRRQEGSERFRILRVASTGNLTLKQLSVENGLNGLNGEGIWHGGGIFNRGELTLKQSKISGNKADWFGGGIFNLGKLTLNRSRIDGNTAGEGGGIFNTIATTCFSTTATLTNSTVSGNTASDGGGIFNECSIVMLTNSTVAGNTASFGGGILNYWYSTTTLTNSTVAGNTARFSAGGIFNHRSTVTLTNSTVVENTVINWNGSNWSSGGIYNDYQSITTLKNTILAGNMITTSNSDCFNDVSGIINTNHYNLFGGDGTECNAGATDLTLTGLGKTITDVLNPTLANNGGPTQTLALVANSPAIDAADDVICPATDQRGVSRPQGAKCDIGAFEYQKPGLIELGDFQAIATPQGIYLKWITTSASDNAGFRLWRANLDQYGEYTNITALDNPQAQTLTATPLEAVTDWNHLIAAGSSAECYSYLDASAAPAGTTYFYLLEDVNMGGYRTFHWGNIVSATVGQNSGGNPQCEDE